MMNYAPSTIDAATWESLVAPTPHNNLLQNWEFATAKAATSPWEVERGIVRDGTTQIAAAQVLVRKLPLGLGGVAWINRAPVCLAATPDPQTVFAAMDALARHYGTERGYYVRIAPPLPEQYDSPMAASPSGYRRTGQPGWASARLDLTGTEDELLKNLRGNWRNSLRKAERAGVDVTIGTDDTHFAAFQALHRQFLADRKFGTSVTPEFLHSLQSLLPEARKMIVLTASMDGTPLASVLIARYGAICEYLAGPSAQRASGMGLGQLLLWRAIIDAKHRGYRLFDLGGMEPGVTPKGIYEFKAGVRPEPYRLVNEREAGFSGLTQKMLRAYVAWMRNS